MYSDFVELISLYDVVTPSATEIIKGKTYYAFKYEWLSCGIISIYSQTFDDEEDYFASVTYYLGIFDKKNFITLAEWREQQINKILEE
jgi:hypothetical protein